MLTKSGAKLLDFGLAKQAGSTRLPAALNEITLEQNRLTSDGQIVGTFQYMAPEQLEGKEADQRTDIFALGELIYEMATGKPPFQGKSRASLIAAILTVPDHTKGELGHWWPQILPDNETYGSADEKLLLSTSRDKYPNSVSPDGKTLLFTTTMSHANGDVGTGPCSHPKRQSHFW
jgi:serine/threonine protein kinase